MAPGQVARASRIDLRGILPHLARSKDPAPGQNGPESLESEGRTAGMVVELNADRRADHRTLGKENKNMKKQAIIIAAFLLTASTALAGGGTMGGGMPGHGTPGNGMPGRPGTPGGMMPGGFGGGMNGMNLVVADNGTVLTIRHTVGEVDVPGSGMTEVVAVAPTGGTLWTWEAEGGIHQLDVAGDLVLVSSVAWDDDHVPGTPGSGMENGSILYALAIHSGAELWQVAFDGRVMNLEPSTNAIYAVVGDYDFEAGTIGEIIPRGGMHPGQPGQPGQGMGELELVAISLDGSILWTTALNQ